MTIDRGSDAGPWFRSRPRLTVSVALALYVAVLVLRFAVDSTQDPITLLFCLPIALLAVAFGLSAGLLAGLSGIFLVAVWVLVEDLSLSILGWATSAVPMLLLGGNVTVKTGLVDTATTPRLLRLLAAGQLDVSSLITHRFRMSDFLEAYDVFAAPAQTGALKVLITAD